MTRQISAAMRVLAGFVLLLSSCTSSPSIPAHAPSPSTAQQVGPVAVDITDCRYDSGAGQLHFGATFHAPGLAGKSGVRFQDYLQIMVNKGGSCVAATDVPQFRAPEATPVPVVIEVGSAIPSIRFVGVSFVLDDRTVLVGPSLSSLSNGGAVAPVGNVTVLGLQTVGRELDIAIGIPRVSPFVGFTNEGAVDAILTVGSATLKNMGGVNEPGDPLRQGFAFRLPRTLPSGSATLTLSSWALRSQTVVAAPDLRTQCAGASPEGGSP